MKKSWKGNNNEYKKAYKYLAKKIRGRGRGYRLLKSRFIYPIIRKILWEIHKHFNIGK